MIIPVIKPVTTERNITIARDASNFHEKKEIVTGTAFCIENTETKIIITTTTKRISIINFYIFIKK
jgi:hypothetical protein